MTQHTIKETVAEDVPALQRVLDETALFPSEMLPEMLQNGAESVWLTCHADGNPVGFCYAAPEMLAEGTWNMLALAVLPACQGQGVGGALTAGLEARLRDAGQRILIVDTSGGEDFAQARGFYQNAGYEHEARIRDYWAAGDDKVTFRKAL